MYQVIAFTASTVSTTYDSYGLWWPYGGGKTKKTLRAGQWRLDSFIAARWTSWY